MPLKVINSIEEVIPGMGIFHKQLGLGKVIKKDNNILQISFIFYAQLCSMMLTPDLYLVNMGDVSVSIGGIEAISPSMYKGVL